jgi:hypothetical protein
MQAQLFVPAELHIYLIATHPNLLELHIYLIATHPFGGVGGGWGVGWGHSLEGGVGWGVQGGSGVGSARGEWGGGGL